MKQGKKWAGLLLSIVMILGTLPTVMAANKLATPTNIRFVKSQYDEFDWIEWDCPQSSYVSESEISLYIIDKYGEAYNVGSYTAEADAFYSYTEIFADFEFGYEDGASYIEKDGAKNVLTVKLKSNSSAYSDSDESDYYVVSPTGISALGDTVSLGMTGSCGSNATWTVTNDNKLIISGTGKADSDSSIREFYEIKNEYGNYAFSEVVIENGIMEIGNDFLSQLPYNKLTLPNTLKRIEANAFSSTSIEYVIIPESVEFMGTDAFSWSDTLQALYFYTKTCELENSSNLYYFMNVDAVVYGYEGSTVYNEIMNEPIDLVYNSQWGTPTTPAGYFCDITKTTGYFRDIADKTHYNAAKAVGDNEIIPQIYANYGKNITRGDLAIALRKMFYGYGTATDLVFTDISDEHKFLKSSAALMMPSLGMEIKDINTFGVNEEVTLDEFIYCLVDAASLYLNGVDRQKTPDTDDLVLELNKIGAFDNVSIGDYVKYEDVALVLYNIDKTTKNGSAIYSSENESVETLVEKAIAEEEKYNFNINYTPTATVYEKTISLQIGSTAATVNGSSETTDAAPKIVNSRTMLPIRFVAEALGAEVGWNGDTRTVTIIKGSTNIAITIDSDKAIVNGQEQILDAPAFVENSRTYLPVRFVSENLGAKVDWDGATQTVTIQAN